MQTMNTGKFEYRKATLEDIPELVHLIATSSRELATNDYSNSQIESAIGTVWGVDEELIRDQTYIAVVVNSNEGKKIVACGGWSKRSKLFGASEGNEASPLLNPEIDASRIRAFFVHPDWARQGIGREIIQFCENEAKQAGFTRMELMATLPGHRLYKACGFFSEKKVICGSNESNRHECVPMWKVL